MTAKSQSWSITQRQGQLYGRNVYGKGIAEILMHADYR
jgi:hypothetical protein